jgi:prepilin-type N-terminal cleavage/methylation domain-containing protein
MKKRQKKTAVRSSDSLTGSQLGMTLIEVLVALGILAAVAVVFLVGMSTSSKAVMVSQESVATDSLAKSELEYVKSVPYTELPSDPLFDPLWEYQLPDNPPTWDLGRTLPAGYSGYSVEVSGYSVGVAYPPEEIQKIKVIVKHNGDEVLTLVGYKVKP